MVIATIPDIKPFAQPLKGVGRIRARAEWLAITFNQIGQHFNVQPTWMALPDGVLGIELILPGDKFEEAEDYLRERYGIADMVPPWHPSHTKGRSVLVFHIPPQLGLTNQPGHINLIMRGNRIERRRCVISAT